jgi:hypothetical protein
MKTKVSRQVGAAMARVKRSFRRSIEKILIGAIGCAAVWAAFYVISDFAQFVAEQH